MEFDFDDSEKTYMLRCLELAEKSLTLNEVPVGCIFVHREKIIAEGHNTVNETKNAISHAEVNCIDEIVKRYNNYNDIFREIMVVVNVEPCIMCCSLLNNLSVTKIIYGCNNERFGGCGTVLDVLSLQQSQIVVKRGLFKEKSVELLKSFYKCTNPNAPIPKLKTRK